jgi:hypothetical protein
MSFNVICDTSTKYYGNKYVQNKTRELNCFKSQCKLGLLGSKDASGDSKDGPNDPADLSLPSKEDSSGYFRQIIRRQM